MSLLPNIREFDNADLTELPSDSKELLAVKYEECLQRRQEAQECCKHKECEQHKQEECEACKQLVCEAWEVHEQAKHEEWEEQEAHKQRDRKEREQTACKEVCRGKVST